MESRDDDGGGPVREDPNSGPGFYSLGANQSSASIFEDVEMAHDEVSRVMWCTLRSCMHLDAPRCDTCPVILGMKHVC